MKVCLECGCRSHGEDWKCPKCGYSPEYHCGYLDFVHDLPGAEDNFDIKYFPKLTEVEDGNFWFESRNRLIIYTLQDYFPNAERFLEIGCGTGFVLSGIKREIPDLIVSGSEIYNEALAFARKRLPDVTLFQMDACRIPFENEFDVIGAFDVIEHIEEDEIVLSQIFRALKSGGGTIITVPQHQWLWSVNDEIACHKRRYSRKELVGKMEDVGFRIICVTSFISLLFPVMVASRLRWRLFGIKQKDRSGELRTPHLINALFKVVCNIERDLVMKGFSFPAGGSLICVGVKE